MKVRRRIGPDNIRGGIGADTRIPGGAGSGSVPAPQRHRILPGRDIPGRGWHRTNGHEPTVSRYATRAVYLLFRNSLCMEPVCHETYPVTTVVCANLLSFLTWGIGIYLISRFGLVPAALYLLFILILEFRLLRGHCTDCWYYGKRCAFGKGSVSALLFRRGVPERFTAMQITWKDILPDFLVFVIPVIAGIILLVRAFSLTVLILVIVLLLLGFAGNALVRGQLACRFCRQREIGCPAAQLFDQGKR